MTAAEEPILFRLDRLDNILKHLEELRGSVRSPRSSFASTTSSTEGHGSSISATDFSPKSMEKHCRPIDDVILETEHKGTVIERLVHVENQMLKVEAEKKREEEQSTRTKKAHKRWLKQFLKCCLKGKSKSNLL
ncbi:uncharacterized protein LOC127801853 isoform X2 [Diospyros lotus]|uniref:uncharacterized protein LOC127801853 isoform X2 n=1 Tax=Diospyros lotus TaxID=55363 RepID=UPI00225177C7|nr:uncharacterized protein LOC127801853 isoform X2 [Diospyros lotus]